MTIDDQKASKKFVCASELARVFKSMICLFLTTSFLFLNMKSEPGLLDDEPYLTESEAALLLEEQTLGPVTPMNFTAESSNMIEEDEASDNPVGSLQAEPVIWVNFLAILCNIVTLINLLFEA